MLRPCPILDHAGSLKRSHLVPQILVGEAECLKSAFEPACGVIGDFLPLRAGERLGIVAQRGDVVQRGENATFYRLEDVSVHGIAFRFRNPIKLCLGAVSLSLPFDSGISQPTEIVDHARNELFASRVLGFRRDGEELKQI